MGKSHQVVFASALLIACTLFSAQRIEAQVLYGSIVGDVLDASGAAIPGATVRVTQTDTGQTRTATTNDAGGFKFLKPPRGPDRRGPPKEGFPNSPPKKIAPGRNNRGHGRLR